LNPVNFVRNGKPEGEMEGYSCQIIADEAEAWFKNHYDREHPFFMYLPFHEPHARVAAPPELVNNYKGFDKSHAEYLACIENMDLAIGRILDYLKEKDLMENTFVLFTSDNGSYRQSSNGKLKAVKSFVYEGGIRVPGIIYYPEQFISNAVVSEAVGSVDLLPTICDLLDIAIPDEKELDGISFLDLLHGGELERVKPLYWYFYRTSPEMAMRIGDHVIMGRDDDTIPKTHAFTSPDMAYIKEMDLVTFELYDLINDIGQNKNLIDTEPEAGRYIELLKNQLEIIQEEGYLWEQLPEPGGFVRRKPR
jgi:arylsulfatase A